MEIGRQQEGIAHREAPIADLHLVAVGQFRGGEIVAAEKFHEPHVSHRIETHDHGQHTIWLVTSREPGRHISYARVTPGEQAGTVTVTITASGDGSEVEVTYQLTVLTGGDGHKLREFADGYPAYLQSWQEAIEASLRRGPGPPGPHAG